MASRRSTAPAHAGWTTTNSRQRLALEIPSSSSPSIISGQEPSPSQQHQQETNEVAESTSTPSNAGNSPSGTGFRSLLNFSTRHRSTSSLTSHRSNGSARSINEIAHWTNSFVHYTPVPPPRSKQPPIIYQPVGPEPPFLPPLTLGSSILVDLLPEESPVFQPLPDIPELPNLEFPWMLNVTDGLEDADTELRPFDGVYSSPSTIHEHADVLGDDTRSSRSTSSDSDNPRTDEPPESITSPMDQPAPGGLSSGCHLGDGPTPNNEQPLENHPATPGPTVKPFDLPQGHNRFSTRDWIRTSRQEPFAAAQAEPSVVVGPTSRPGTAIQHGDIVRDPCDDVSLVTASEYSGGLKTSL